MIAYSPADALSQINYDRKVISRAALIAGKRAAQVKLAQDEEAIREAVANAGFTRRNGLLANGISNAFRAYVGTLSAAADGAMQAQIQYETSALNNAASRTQTEMSVYSRGKSSLITSNAKITVAESEINSDFVQATFSLNTDADSKALQEQHKMDLFNIKTKADVDLKVLQHNAGVRLKLDEIGWQNKAERAVAIEQFATKSNVLDVNLANDVILSKNKQAASINIAGAESVARNTASVNESSAKVLAETERGQAKLAAVDIQNVANVARIGVVNQARIDAASLVNTADIAGVNARTAAKIASANLLSSTRIANSGRENAAMMAANSIEQNARIAANEIEINGKIASNAQEVSAKIINGQKIIEGKAELVKLTSTLQTKLMSDKSNARIKLTEKKIQAQLLNTQEVLTGRLLNIQDKSDANEKALKLQLSGQLEGKNKLFAQQLESYREKSLSDLEMSQMESDANITGLIELQAATLASDTDIFIASDRARDALNKARIEDNALQAKTRATVSNIEQLANSGVRVLNHAAEAIVRINSAKAKFWDSVGHDYAEQVIAIDTQVQTTYHIKE